MGGQDGFYKLPARASAKAAFACLTVIKMEKKRVENVISDPSAFLSSLNCSHIAAGAVVQPCAGTEGASCCRSTIAEPCRAATKSHLNSHPH